MKVRSFVLAFTLMIPGFLNGQSPLCTNVKVAAKVNSALDYIDVKALSGSVFQAAQNRAMSIYGHLADINVLLAFCDVSVESVSLEPLPPNASYILLAQDLAPYLDQISDFASELLLKDPPVPYYVIEESISDLVTQAQTLLAPYGFGPPLSSSTASVHKE